MTENDIHNIIGKCSDFDDVCVALKYFKEKGEHVYYLFNGCCMNSDDVDKYVNVDYVYKNCSAYIKVGPITSIDDFVREIECIGDWKDSKNQALYVKIILQFIGMYNGYRTNLTLDDGIEGKFKGNYPREYVEKLIDVIAEKFPKTEDIFIDNKLRPEFDIDDEDRMFYRFLGSFNAGKDYGISFLAERTNFVAEARESGIIYDDSKVNIDVVRNMIQQANTYSKRR